MIKIRPITSALALALYGTGALAQGPIMLEKVIVTAQKRSESLQDVPVAVNAFSADTIQEAGINNANDLAVMTPSLHSLSLNSPFQTKLQIRGIGTAQNDPEDYKIATNEPEDVAFKDRTLVNAKLGWRNDHWNLSVWS